MAKNVIMFGGLHFKQTAKKMLTLKFDESANYSLLEDVRRCLTVLSGLMNANKIRPTNS
ncbi:hypothetical protein QN416_13755 [Glaciimonas sp. Cout2]|nr:hypothetical protein [Glaciimonas sp. Cout2]